MRCAVCKKTIYGRRQVWNNRVMCQKCHAYFCGHVRVIRRPAAAHRQGSVKAFLRRVLRNLA